MSKAITLELTADRANSLASIIKGFVLLNKMKGGLLIQESELFLTELGYLEKDNPDNQQERLTCQQQDFRKRYMDSDPA